MKIVHKKEFSNALDNILDYITEDSLNRALAFNRELQKSINTLSDMPYKYRKSYYHNHDEVRDMIFKGYTIPYKVDKANNLIVILDIFKWMNK